MFALTSHSALPGTVIYDSDVRRGTEYSNPINYSALGLEFLYRHPGYQEEYQLYLDNENPELEDHILQQDLSDLPNRFDDIQLEKILSGEQAIGRKYPEAPDYNLHDYQNEGPVFSPYYMPQLSTGNERYFPVDYRQSPDHYAIVKNPRTKKINMWSRPFLPMTPGMQNFPFRENLSTKKRKHRKRRYAFEKLEVNNRKAKNKLVLSRNRRHVGPHDGGGIQRVISTGTLAPSFSKDGIDIIYATFWFYPSDIQSLLPEDKECIDLRMQQEKERFKPSSIYYGMDHDTYEEMVTEECLKKSGHLKSDKNRRKDYNPFNRPMGQMTVYRTHLNCLCPRAAKSGFKCAKILPFSEQMWTSYMGPKGNCVAKYRHFL